MALRISKSVSDNDILLFTTYQANSGEYHPDKKGKHAESKISVKARHKTLSIVPH